MGNEENNDTTSDEHVNNSLTIASVEAPALGSTAIFCSFIFLRAWIGVLLVVEDITAVDAETR